MVEISRDGKRVYFTNSLYGAVDPQFYPDGIDGWMVKLDAGADGGIDFDPRLLRATGRRATARIRCGCKAATAPPIPTAIRDGISCHTGESRYPGHPATMSAQRFLDARLSPG